MKFSRFFTVLALTTGCINLSIARADPGCLRMIQGKAISETAAKLLPAGCRDFRKSYLKSLHLLSHDPKKFSREMSREILAKKSFEPPYDAILISTFPKNISDELKSAIQTRAKIESTKKFKYKYALAAEERITKGACSDVFAEAAYDEICRSKDLVYQRIEALTQGMKK